MLHWVCLEAQHSSLLSIFQFCGAQGLSVALGKIDGQPSIYSTNLPNKATSKTLLISPTAEDFQELIIFNTCNKNTHMVAVSFFLRLPQAGFELNVKYASIQNFLFYGKKLCSYTSFYIISGLSVIYILLLNGYYVSSFLLQITLLKTEELGDMFGQRGKNA